MANPGQDAPVRMALEHAGHVEGRQIGEFRVVSGQLKRVQNTNKRYYHVQIESDYGGRSYRVAVDRSWMESRSPDGTQEIATV